jgi:low affinity Fe/Cu permease
MKQWFADLTRKVSSAAGSWQASLAAFLVIVAWLIGGFYFGFLDPVYQLVINTVTTICTFLMVFLIQSAQNRDTKAIHVKLNDLIVSIKRADDKLINIEKASDEEIDQAEKNIDQNIGGEP